MEIIHYFLVIKKRRPCRLCNNRRFMELISKAGFKPWIWAVGARGMKLFQVGIGVGADHTGEMIDLWIGFYSPLRARSSLGLIRRSLIDLWSSSTRKSCLLFLQVCVQDAAAPIHKKPPKNFRKNAEEVKKKIKMNRPVLLVSLMFYPAEPHQHKQDKNKTEMWEHCVSSMGKGWRTVLSDRLM